MNTLMLNFRSTNFLIASEAEILSFVPSNRVIKYVYSRIIAH